jgi:hypothetical protein
VTAAGCYLLSFSKKFFPSMLGSFPAIETSTKLMIKVFAGSAISNGR